jgi:hypothetical protein
MSTSPNLSNFPKGNFFLVGATEISTGRTRQDSEKWFFLCETFGKIWIFISTSTEHE